MQTREKESSSLWMGRYSVLGSLSEGTRFVTHAALVRDDNDQEQDKVWVSHMGPPLGETELTPDVFVDVRLEKEEQEAIKHWIAKVWREQRQGRKRFRQYVINPHYKWHLQNGRRLYRRFSCVGYVIEAYKEAKLELIDLKQLPIVEHRTLEKAYPDLQRIANAPQELRARLERRLGFQGLAELGIDKNNLETYRIVLCGYAFHSLARFRDGTRGLPGWTPNSEKYGSYPA